MSNEQPEPRQVINLIGTETCSFCGALTECLQLPDDGMEPCAGCCKCIAAAFAETFGEETKP